MINLLQKAAERKLFVDIDLLHVSFNSWKRVHRAEESLKFLQSCFEKKVCPNFIKISTTQMLKVCLTKLEIKRFETRKLEKERNKKTTELKILEHQFNLLSQKILNLCYIPTDHIFFLNLIKNNVRKFEQKSDLRRSKKLQNLVFELETDFNVVNIHNRTNITMPQNIIDVIRFGKNRGIGSPFKDHTNIIEIDKLVKSFEHNARKNNVPSLRWPERKVTLHLPV